MRMILSVKNPAASAEGRWAPLGQYQIADALGVKLIPGIRERMSHPRYLTLAAAAACGEFDEETVALYNTYDFGYAFGKNFRNKEGRREMLWPGDVDELAEHCVSRSTATG